MHSDEVSEEIEDEFEFGIENDFLKGEESQSDSEGKSDPFR